ncbi:MAG TPA: chorismate mutase [Selenomonadales bacterium]|nr:chorismate mutase [Selenomonadales bacterium]
MRGVRGATTVEANDRGQIMARVAEMLEALVAENHMEPDELAAAIFSATPDLDAAFPAAAARTLGWSEVPLFGAQELEAEGGVPLCIRVLLLWNTDKQPKEIKHIYLHGASVLRPDFRK